MINLVPHLYAIDDRPSRSVSSHEATDFGEIMCLTPHAVSTKPLTNEYIIRMLCRDELDCCRSARKFGDGSSRNKFRKTITRNQVVSSFRRFPVNIFSESNCYYKNK